MVQRWLAVMGLVAGVGLLSETATAQNQDRTQIMRKHAQRVAAHIDRIPARHSARLSAGAMMIKGLNDSWSRFEALAAQVPGGGGAGLAPLAGGIGPRFPISALLPAGKVSDPKADLTFSSMAGFTQSESSTAWCGSRVVIAFNDSGSFPESFFIGPGGGSFNGYSVSSNAGTTFKDFGFLNPSADPNFFLSGDPVVGCTDVNTFYYASLLEDYGPGDTAISVSKSINGGVAWADPVKAVAKSLAGHFLDKEWMAVDPSNPSNIFVTYTDFDSSFPNSCSSTTSVFRTAIEFVRSTDAGVTWSAPVIIDEACDPDGNQGSQVAVNNAGHVYVSYEHFPALLPNNQIRVSKSTDGGATFSLFPDAASLAITPTAGVSGALGGRQTLTGRIRTNDFPSMAIDRTSPAGPRQGWVYIAWQDGGRNPVPDALSGSGSYNYADIKISRSSDGGATWSAPVIVNNTIEPIPTGLYAGLGSDQFFPGVAVDRTGAVGVCFYDRRRDFANFLIDRECAKSTTGGAPFGNVRKNGTAFMSVSSQDFVIAAGYQGDYDSLASDALRLMSGFRGGYSDHTLGNQDMKVNVN